MKKVTLSLLSFCLALLSVGQTSENLKLIELANAYKNFMFRNEPPKSVLKELKFASPESLKFCTDFIIETITTDNDIIKKKYLSLPDTLTLKMIYIIRSINYNIREEKQIDNNKLIDSLKLVEIPKVELIDAYYSIIFASVGNKNKPFDFSKINFSSKDYNLINDTERGIFFLQCMSYCGREIWGYMNVVKPANTKTAFEYIKNYPRFNSLKYFQFTDLNFPDFEMLIVKDKGKQSYKSYYIDKYYELLLSHLICLKKEGSNEKEVNDLLLGSILRDRNLYQYTKHKEILESIFKEQKQE